MKHPAVLFRFRLSGGQSIGPDELRRLWAIACGSEEVSVSRVVSAWGSGDIGHTYSLCGPARVVASPEIEQRTRDSLTAALPKANIVLTRM
jgi:hypothetical protein